MRGLAATTAPACDGTTCSMRQPSSLFARWPGADKRLRRSTERTARVLPDVSRSPPASADAACWAHMESAERRGADIVASSCLPRLPAAEIATSLCPVLSCRAAWIFLGVHIKQGGRSGLQLRFHHPAAGMLSTCCPPATPGCIATTWRASALT